MKLDIQPCLKSWLFLKPLCLSKQPAWSATVTEDEPVPVSAPKRRISAPIFRLTRSQTLRHQILMVCKYIQICRVASFVNPTLATRDKQSGGVHWSVVTLIRSSNKCRSSFPDDTSELEKQRGRAWYWESSTKRWYCSWEPQDDVHKPHSCEQVFRSPHRC